MMVVRSVAWLPETPRDHFSSPTQLCCPPAPRPPIDGDAATVDESPETTQELATKQAKGAKLASVGRGARGSKVHDTKRAMQDDEYSAAGAE